MITDSQASKQQETTTTELTGVVEKIIFHNTKNGYTVLLFHADTSIPVTLRSRRNKHQVTCVGILLNPEGHEHLALKGTWVTHDQYGHQFQFSESREIFPTKDSALHAYLTSGFIRGIGPALATRIINAFGSDTITILDTEPRRLLEIEGLGKKTFDAILESWSAHTVIRDLVLFLQPHGILPQKAARVYAVYGSEALAKIKENPYCLTIGNCDISFEKADILAKDLGFPPDSPLRLEAYIISLLLQARDKGHVYLTKEQILKQSCKLAEFREEQAEEALLRLGEDERLVLERWDIVEQSNEEKNANSDLSAETVHEEACYLPHFYRYETGIAKNILRILSSPKSILFNDPDAEAEAITQRFPLNLAQAQKEAILMAAKSKMLIITGGPGTGKTTILKAVISLFKTKKASIQLAAPTGKAARRMQEATQYSAKTIHRLLEFSPDGEYCERNETNPLSCDLLIIDEVSMIDIGLLHKLLKATPLGCTVIFVGDMYQLPSVGPGQVLADLISSHTLPMVKLYTIFRQSSESAIVRYAHEINKGQVPKFQNDHETRNDFYFLEVKNAHEAADTITELVTTRLPGYYGFDPCRDIQVLSPMHMGEAGVIELNKRLQEILNPQTDRVERLQSSFGYLDKVMQIRNNYDKEVFNGDTGIIVDFQPKRRELIVQFEENLVPYSFDELDELITSYAISIHKSQGSEYPCVVIPLVSTHWWMLQRNLLYTAVTRGKKLVCLVGERKALFQAIRHKRDEKRLTHMAQRIHDLRYPPHI
ncbi:MAG: ATP-dependent RecD-like DNA helicase [Desulfovibrio sp.]|nr:ATP-dependent RecD-like DNA helicase [Desulfovibrio sp.]